MTRSTLVLRNVERVMDAAVHAHAAKRVVKVRGIAGEEYASLAIALRHALVNRIERAMRDVVAPRLRMHALQPPLDGRIRKNVGLAFLRLRGEHRAPDVAHPQQEEPF